MTVKNDLAGRRFGRLVAIEMLETSGHGGRQWLCQCDCGEKKITTRGKLTDGGVQSCGCLHRESVAERSRTHGMSSSPEWMAWHMLRDRCNNPRSHAYDDYGGRGITVDPVWNESFEAFFAHVGPRPSPEYTLDRIDNNKGYQPGNCRWATRSTQQLNRRVVKHSQTGVRGVYPNPSGEGFVARMMVNGVVVLNQNCATLEEAAAVRQAAEKVHLTSLAEEPSSCA